jgi:hypothetical protein
MSDSPSLTSGRKSIKDPIVENLNVLVASVALRYHFIDDSLKVVGRVIEHALEGEGDVIGFDIKSEGVEKGGLNLQLDSPTDVAPQPGHRLKVTKGTSIKYYGVSEGGAPNKRNDVVRPSPSVIQEINPFLSGLLSETEGDLKRQSYSIAAMGATETVATTPINGRTGGVIAVTATQSDGSALPTGVAINASTGVITVTKATVLAGVYTIQVVVTDTLTGYSTRSGEATLVLTITA